LKNADEEFDVKHPIILPSSHHVTRLLIENHYQVNELLGHGNYLDITHTKILSN